MKQGKWMLLFLAVMLLCSACSTGYDEMPDERRADGQEDRLAEETERLAEGYRGLYEEAVEEGSEDSLELKQGIISVRRDMRRRTEMTRSIWLIMSRLKHSAKRPGRKKRQSLPCFLCWMKAD